MTDANTDSTNIHYTFTWPDQKTLTYDIHINKSTLLSQEPDASRLPEWTRLEVEQCTGCPLQSPNSPHCPVAARLFELTEAFRAEKSYAEVEVKVETRERTVVKKIALQKGIQSILGVLMPTSG